MLTPVTPYGSWIATQAGVPTGMGGFNDDANGDGIANGLAWFLGGSAMSDVRAVLPVETQSAGMVQLNFNRRHDSGGATLYLEYGTSLSDWVSVAIPASTITGVGTTGMNIVITPGTDLDQVSVQVPVSAGAGKQLFLRLRAQQ